MWRDIAAIVLGSVLMLAGIAYLFLTHDGLTGGMLLLFGAPLVYKAAGIELAAIEDAAGVVLNLRSPVDPRKMGR